MTTRARAHNKERPSPSQHTTAVPRVESRRQQPGKPAVTVPDASRRGVHRPTAVGPVAGQRPAAAAAGRRAAPERCHVRRVVHRFET